MMLIKCYFADYNGGYHLFCLKPKFTQVPIDIWYYSSCFLAAPWFLFKPCHTFPSSRLGGGYMRISSQPFVHCIYICVCISFWLISFYLWLVLVFLFSKVYYAFTTLWHRMSQHYTSQHMFILHLRLLSFLGIFKWNILKYFYLYIYSCLNMSYIFYNQFWINTHLWNYIDFVKFCVLSWKIVTISNHTKTC
jgi:hypothetical protein